MDKIHAVQKMQNYICEHLNDDDFSIEDVCRTVGYSRRNAERLFKEYLNTTLRKYIDSVCLTNGAKDLLDTKKTVAYIAYDNHFKSHEGFTRSFNKKFHITPSEYRNQKIAIPLFVQYPILNYYVLLKYKEELNMSNNISLCMITPQERPKRKLIYLPSKKAQDYVSYCEEVGCEWEGLLNSIPEKLDTAALIDLPDFLVENGFSKIAAGVEVPLDYNKVLPTQYKVAELLPCTMLYFQSEPYEKQEDFCIAIESAYNAISKYNPTLYGYKFSYDIAPSFNFGAEMTTGAKIAVPVLHI